MDGRTEVECGLVTIGAVTCVQARMPIYAYARAGKNANLCVMRVMGMMSGWLHMGLHMGFGVRRDLLQSNT